MENQIANDGKIKDWRLLAAQKVNRKQGRARARTIQWMFEPSDLSWLFRQLIQNKLFEGTYIPAILFQIFVDRRGDQFKISELSTFFPRSHTSNSYDSYDTLRWLWTVNLLAYLFYRLREMGAIHLTSEMAAAMSKNFVSKAGKPISNTALNTHFSDFKNGVNIPKKKAIIDKILKEFKMHRMGR